MCIILNVTHLLSYKTVINGYRFVFDQHNFYSIDIRDRVYNMNGLNHKNR